MSGKLVKMDERLREMALRAKETEAGSAESQFISTRGGVLSIDGSPVPGNRLIAVVLDHVLENRYYTGDYNPDNIVPPECYAFGKDAADMRPHEKAIEPQAESCSECLQNAWGSGKGRGKACSNTRRLAVIPAGTVEKGEDILFDAAEQFGKSQLSILKLPVMSVKGYTAWVRQLAEVMGRPPLGVIAAITCEPDEKSMFRIKFETITEIKDNGILSVLFDRAEGAAGEISQPYGEAEIEEKPKPRRGKKKPKSRKY